MADMQNSYAEALFELACEDHIETEMLNAIYDFNKIIEENPEYLTLLNSPMLDKEKKETLIKEALEETFPLEFILFLVYMSEKKLMEIFPQCALEYKLLYDEMKNTVLAKITSAVELTEEEKNKILRKLEMISSKNIFPEYEIDKTLLGGVIVEMNGKIYDGSYRKKFDDLKKVMKE